MDAGLKREIEEKVYAGERLSRADGVALYSSDDLAWLGRLAHHRRTGRSGDRVLFDVNRHLNLTNVCGASCAYCSFQRKPGERDAYTMEIEEAVARARETVARETPDDRPTELHIVNGLHPTLPWDYYPAVLSALRAALPTVRLNAFTATEVHWFERISGRPAGELLDELIGAGLDSLTGGGADIFDPEVRQRIVDHDCHWEDWSRIHRLAHARGVRTPSTMLYGHIEEPRHRVDHVLRLRELQDETGGFTTFAPQRYLHDAVAPADGGIRNRLQAQNAMAAPAESLKTLAVSRLLFDNVPHVRCSRATHGLSVTQLALNFGVDDVDGSVIEHGIVQVAGGDGAPGAMRREALLHLIWDAGFRPVERDTRYDVLREYAAPPSLAERRSEPQQVWA
jgi:aminodeoxyfutalosine synthase